MFTCYLVINITHFNRVSMVYQKKSRIRKNVLIWILSRAHFEIYTAFTVCWGLGGGIEYPRPFLPSETFERQKELGRWRTSVADVLLKKSRLKDVI